MSVDSPKVRDFTTQTQSLGVTVEASPVYELLLSMFIWGSKDESAEYECGSTFFEQLEADEKGSAAGELSDLVGSGELWLPLIGLAQASGRISSVDNFLDYLEELDPIELRGALLNSAFRHVDVADEDAAAAAAGDAAAIAKIISLDKVPTGFGDLIAAAVDETPARIVATLRAVNVVLERSISDTLPALGRDADEKRSLGRSMDAQKLVETATNGVTFKMDHQITGVVLIPSKIIRPWTVIIEHEGLRIFAYSVSDEHLSADPDTPPSYLVDLYKALGDERRLRMLAMLSESDMGLMEIADRVDLAKSTAHHHLRILRSAGLVRVTVGETKSYSLRREGVPEAARLLDAYLTTPDAAAQVAPSLESERN
jgi:DNA-binding transcriptional ArsR family regulator